MIKKPRGRVYVEGPTRAGGFLLPLPFSNEPNLAPGFRLRQALLGKSQDARRGVACMAVRSKRLPEYIISPVPDAFCYKASECSLRR